MKLILSLFAAACTLASTALAGINYNFIQPERLGAGAYVALQGGFNADQTTYGETVFGYEFQSESNTGGFGGIKAGYTFCEDSVMRPSLEVDAFYNGFTQDINLVTPEIKVGEYKVRSGALLLNGLFRYDLGHFQPYFGAGIGGCYYSSKTTFLGLTGDNDDTSLAWQLIGGADIYVTSCISFFAEYKFLNYVDVDSDNLRQHLAGAGIRFHF